MSLNNESINKNKHKFTSGGELQFTKTKLKYIASLVITLVGLLSLFGGTSYAILKGSTSSDNTQVIKAGSIKIKLTENFESINKKISIMEDSVGLLHTDVYEFNIKNIGDAPAKYDIKLVNEKPTDYTGNLLNDKYIKVGLEINEEEYGPFTLKEVNNIIDSDIIYEKEMINYSLRIWLDKDSEEEISNLEDSKAFLKLKVDAEQRVEEMDNGVNTTIFNYTGDVQKYKVPRDGYYYIEMAGAEGGSAKYTTSYSGGKGAKTSGYVYLNAGDKLYFYVGGMGTSHSGTTKDTPTANGNGYNGGSTGHFYASNSNAGGGGGATDVRLAGGSWDNTSSLISRIMVAGGGGGADSHTSAPSNSGYGGNGEALYGQNAQYINSTCYRYGSGGTQNSGGSSVACSSSYKTEVNGSFGKGDNSQHSSGGGGYYGGGGGQHSSAGGGSSYISGYAGVNSVKESTTITHTNQTLHYSKKYFVGGQMISGTNSGNGYAKISYVDLKPKRRNTKLNNVRYIKNCTNYNSTNNANHWIEIQAIKDGVNIAKGKTVTGTTTENTSFPYSRITDGDITYANYSRTSSNAPNQCVTVDLESSYNLDEVAVWNYFGDQRSYHDNITSVSSDNSTWKAVINEASVETSNGHRINAYTDTLNGYVNDKLVLWYDGYANNGGTRNYTTTTWQDLSGSGYHGTRTGGTWNENFLYFDGSDDTVLTKVTPSSLLPLDSDYTMSMTVKINSVPYTNTTNGNTGVLFGAAYYNGTGIAWTRTTSSSSFSVEGFSRGENAHSSDLGTYTYPTDILHFTYVNKPSEGKIKTYVNGKFYSSNDKTDAPYSYVSNMGNIGIDKNQIWGGNGTASYANMNVYNAKIYKKALTDEEILHNYNYDKQTLNLK